MFNIVFCDDDLSYAKDIWSMIKNKYTWDDTTNVCFFKNGKELMDTLEHQDMQIDLLALDVEMPMIDGISVKDALINDNRVRRIIFLTGHAESIGLAFGYKVHNFYVKYRDEERLVNAIAGIREELDKTMVIKLKNLALNMEDLVYIESEREYSYVYHRGISASELMSEKIRLPIKKWRTILPDKMIAQASQSYLVNLIYFRIDKDGDYFTLRNDPKIKIPISRHYKKDAKDRFFKFQMELAYQRSI